MRFRDIQNISFIIVAILAIVIFLISFRFEYVLLVLLGALASNLNFLINIKFLDLTGSMKAFARNLGSFIFRMIIYTLVMILGYYWQELTGLIIVFAGCLVIRVAILIYGIKGGIVDGYNK